MTSCCFGLCYSNKSPRKSEPATSSAGATRKDDDLDSFHTADGTSNWKPSGKLRNPRNLSISEDSGEDNESFCTAISDPDVFATENCNPASARELQLLEEVGLTAGDLGQLREKWLNVIQPQFMPDIIEDPYWTPRGSSLNRVLLRYLRAEKNQKSHDPVATAADRLYDTACFRRDYRCSDFHRPGGARKVMMHASNPGACAYFADYGLRDKQNEPVLVGRISLMVDHKAPGWNTAHKMIPSTHLRAVMFVIERAACESRESGSYILDLGSYPVEAMSKYDNKRYWDADGTIDCSHVIAERCAPTPSVGPHLPEHETLPDGLPTLKEALRLMTTYYPDFLNKVYFYRPTFLFKTIFAVFSMWVPSDTRQKFVLVNEGEEHKYFLSPNACNPTEVPPELGGKGAPLDGDRFILKAIERYDRSSLLPAVDSV
eukprot:TRINITY_DN80071_c0_g1_i1.p1 TRINITY_DN80071_c0_g1~~TRINITY_DN80071_c0_g1_i1.p1  ORF type:complete len:430 (+),score=44.43 TRINITY_DN80071_c0_g1_i1:25-1314(+)